MRLLPFACTVALLTAPAAAQELGERTRSPESLLSEFGLAPGQDDLSEAIAAAQAHPLGSRENPVRVGGPEGERAYIARLRCADGSAPRVGQRGSAGVGAFGTVVDVYPLDCGSAAPGRTSLIMDMYHSEHEEDGAPPGFAILPR
ncbi:hypothetical protein [Sphingosinicella sp. CPCC 101087]|uniref:hypothetical protein n=1 Tax=Sphingosinicella sp. CPCC 101087 TaxID=2497754 RepID=UPI00101C5857|nr:hypothetical protein [Sphingosinicella sp. CPCC 101087]